MEDQIIARLAAKLTNDLSKFKCNIFYVDPLLFWKRKQHVYFQLSKVAKAYFGIPVTSALVERFFSKNVFILRPHRLCMQDDLAENLFYAK